MISFYSFSDPIGFTRAQWDKYTVLLKYSLTHQAIEFCGLKLAATGH